MPVDYELKLLERLQIFMITTRQVSADRKVDRRNMSRDLSVRDHGRDMIQMPHRSISQLLNQLIFIRSA